MSCKDDILNSCFDSLPSPQIQLVNEIEKNRRKKKHIGQFKGNINIFIKLEMLVRLEGHLIRP